MIDETEDQNPWESIPSLTDLEVMELDVHAAQRLIAENTQILAEMNNEIQYWTQQLGEARMSLDKLKAAKSCIVEINRSLKTICTSG